MKLFQFYCSIKHYVVVVVVYLFVCLRRTLATGCPVLFLNVHTVNVLSAQPVL